MTPAATEQLDAYVTHQRQNASDREIEARALLNCALKMDEACEPHADIESYTAALKLNQRLWTIFQVALCDPENPLPAELKTILLNLSRYVDKTSFQAIATRDVDSVKSLITINRHIAVGLSAKPPAAKTAPAAMAPPPEIAAGSVMTSA